MKLPVPTHRFHIAAGIVIGAVGVFYGLYSKLLDGIPRHRQIVARVLGESAAAPATIAVGLLEVALGVWAFSGRKRRAGALTQTLAIAGMNAVEILLARDLLISSARTRQT